MVEAQAIEKDKKYDFVNQNGEENGAMNEVVNMHLHSRSLEFSENGLDLKNTGFYKNERGEWTIHKKCLNVVIIIIIIIIILLLIILFAVRSEERCPNLLPAVLTAPCPDGWIGYRKKCYYFSLTDGNWTVGSRHCSSQNASLAVVDSQEEKDFLFRYKSLPDHWIGLQKDFGQPWRWVNGSIFTEEWLFKLREGEGRRCAYLNHNAIASSSCTREEPWICSKEMAKDIGWIAKAKP